MYIPLSLLFLLLMLFFGPAIADIIVFDVFDALGPKPSRKPSRTPEPKPVYDWRGMAITAACILVFLATVAVCVFVG
jgi:hypothetical protein